MVEGARVITALPVDAIPTIDNRRYVSVAEAEHFTRYGEPVRELVEGANASAYSGGSRGCRLPVSRSPTIPRSTTSRPADRVDLPVHGLRPSGILPDRGEATLTFDPPRCKGGEILLDDRESETTWHSLSGHGVEDSLAPMRLAQIPAALAFSSSWNRFFPILAPASRPDGARPTAPLTSAETERANLLWVLWHPRELRGCQRSADGLGDPAVSPEPSRRRICTGCGAFC